MSGYLFWVLLSVVFSVMWFAAPGINLTLRKAGITCVTIAEARVITCANMMPVTLVTMTGTLFHKNNVPVFLTAIVLVCHVFSQQINYDLYHKRGSLDLTGQDPGYVLPSE
jgi:hypothetical protein